MKRITVLVSGNGTNLQNLIDASKNKIVNSGKINLVISSNQNAKALIKAKKENIKTMTLNRHNFLSQQMFDKELIELLHKNKTDLIVLAGYLQIISKVVALEFKNKIINIHPSLIPSFCGKGYFGIKVHEQVLNAGVKITGATVHFVNEKIDSGPIIIQKSVKVFSNDTPQSLQQRVLKEAEFKILPQAVELFCSNKIKIKNNKAIIES